MQMKSGSISTGMPEAETIYLELKQKVYKLTFLLTNLWLKQNQQ